MVESGCFESNCMQIPGVRIPLCPKKMRTIANKPCSLGEIGKHGRLKICSLWVAGSSPAASK